MGSNSKLGLPHPTHLRHPATLDALTLHAALRYAHAIPGVCYGGQKLKWPSVNIAVPFAEPCLQRLYVT